MRIGFGMLGNLDIHESLRFARRAEELGYDSLWFTEHNFSRDGVSVCAAAAAATERIVIGPSVIPIFTRSALLVATTFASLDELSKGRIVLGIGAGSRLLIRAQGIAYDKPLTALREYVEACRAIWNAEHGGHINYDGEVVHLEEAELDFVPYRRDLPVYLGPTGPKACQLAGEIGEGALLNCLLPTEYVVNANEWIAEGAARGGREVGDVDIAMLIITAVADSKEAAHDFLRPVVATYLARLPDIARHTAIWKEWDDLANAVASGGGEAGKRFISDELIDDVTICGTVEDCRQAFQRFAGAGLDHVIFAAVGDQSRVLEELNPAVLR